MAQSSLQTQCPKCRTRFRVTDEQLGIAKGKVRCGHCMDVFNALEHRITGGASEPVKTSSAADFTRHTDNTPAESRARNSQGDSSDDDLIFADNPEEDAEHGSYAGTRLTFSDDELSDSFRNIDESDTHAANATDDPQPGEEVDESWAEAMLREHSAAAEDEPARPHPTQPGDEPGSAVPEKHAHSEPQDAPDQGGVVEQAEPTPEPVQQEHAKEPESGRLPDDDEPFAAGTPYGNLRHDPVSVGGKKSSWLRTLAWLIVVLGLLGALVAQLVWFQFDRLSAVPELRPFYEKGCELAGCELTPLINVDAIQSRKLVVRTHPENRQQLIVDAVIINRADFQQPFPAIALTFSNLNGDVVAQSIFTPSEYLAGEAQQLDNMPVDTPVRIAIDIRDPGRDAVNYNLIFRPHTP